MRIVVAVVVVTLFILWEVMYDNWQFTNAVINEVMRVLHAIGL